MLIRCEKCRALFSLPDVLAAKQLECGRCKFVFALPERGAPKVAPAKPGQRPLAQPKGFDWQAPALLGIAVGLLLFAFFLWRSRAPHLTKAAAARIAQGEKLLLKDDLASLDQAAQLFTDAAHLSPRMALPEAQRALALLLQSSTRTQLQDPAATRYLQQGVAAARTAMKESPLDPAVLRAVALAQVLSGSQKDAAQTLQGAGSDAWTEYVRSTAAPEADGALAALDHARKLQPQLLRAEVDEARLVSATAPQRAKDLLSHVLSENPKHELAQRLSK
jgi:hypothetical protein